MPVTAGSSRFHSPASGAARGAPQPIRAARGAPVKAPLGNGGKHQLKEQQHRGTARDMPEETTASGWSPEPRK